MRGYVSTIYASSLSVLFLLEDAKKGMKTTGSDLEI